MRQTMSNTPLVYTCSVFSLWGLNYSWILSEWRLGLNQQRPLSACYRITDTPPSEGARFMLNLRRTVSWLASSRNCSNMLWTSSASSWLTCSDATKHIAYRLTGKLSSNGLCRPFHLMEWATIFVLTCLILCDDCFSDIDGVIMYDSWQRARRCSSRVHVVHGYICIYLQQLLFILSVRRAWSTGLTIWYNLSPEPKLLIQKCPWWTLHGSAGSAGEPMRSTWAENGQSSIDNSESGMYSLSPLSLSFLFVCLCLSPCTPVGPHSQLQQNPLADPSSSPSPEPWSTHGHFFTLTGPEPDTLRTCSQMFSKAGPSLQLCALQYPRERPCARPPRFSPSPPTSPRCCFRLLNHRRKKLHPLAKCWWFRHWSTRWDMADIDRGSNAHSRCNILLAPCNCSRSSRSAGLPVALRIHRGNRLGIGLLGSHAGIACSCRKILLSWWRFARIDCSMLARHILARLFVFGPGGLPRSSQRAPSAPGTPAPPDPPTTWPGWNAPGISDTLTSSPALLGLACPRRTPSPDRVGV